MTRTIAIAFAACLAASGCTPDGGGDMAGIDRPTSMLGETDSYVLEGDWATNQTTGLRWQRMPTARLPGAAAEQHCRSLGARLPTREELYRLGRWGHAHRALANEMFVGNATKLEGDQITEITPAGSFFWATFWSSTTWRELRWSVDYSGTIQDSLGVPVVGCLVEPKNEVLVRCVR